MNKNFGFSKGVILFIPLMFFLVVGAGCSLNTGSNPTTDEAEALKGGSGLESVQIDLDSISVDKALEQLDSYRTNIVADFDGSLRGKQSVGQIEAVTEVHRPSNVHHYYQDIAAEIPEARNPAGISEYFLIDDQIYITQSGEVSRFETGGAGPVPPEEIGFIDLSKLIVLPGSSAQPAQIESQNGLEVVRFQFDQADLNHPAIVFEQAEGEIWVATASELVLGYTLSATVRIPTPLPNAHILDAGRLNLSYTLTDVNTDFPVNPPAAFETGTTSAGQFPRLPDAEITAFFPTLIEYTSVVSPVSATLYYQDELMRLGWTAKITTVFQEKSRLTFSKEDQTATILINSTDNPDKVKISINLETRP